MRQYEIERDSDGHVARMVWRGHRTPQVKRERAPKAPAPAPDASQPSLSLELEPPAPRKMADTSLAAWEQVKATVTERECRVYLALCDATSYGRADCTGGELADWMGTLTTSIRPRLSGLYDKGLVLKRPTRQSRAKYEGRCHPYVPLVPRAAVARRLAELTQEVGE